ncbi:MAG: DUF433 domain-containing protein [Parafilimonas sp.]
MKYLERITMDANICHGKPCIRGMRWPVITEQMMKILLRIVIRKI